MATLYADGFLLWVGLEPMGGLENGIHVPLVCSLFIK